MNNSSLNGTNSTTSETAQALDLARDIMIYYGSRGISIVGIFVNLFGLLALRDRHLEEKFYDCLFCRCFCNLVVCLFGSLHCPVPCLECKIDYILGCLEMYVHFPGFKMALMASIVCEVLLILNRLVLLFNKRTNVICTLSRKANLVICYSIPIISTIPYYFAIQVVKASNSTTETQGYTRLTDFGRTIYFQIYAFAGLLLEGIIPTLLLIILNTVSLIKFRMVVRKVAQTNFMRTVEINLVRLVLILTFICIFTRVFDLLTAFLIRFNAFFGIILSAEMNALKNLVKQISIFCLYSAHSLDSIFCYYYDRHLKHVAYQLIRKPFRKLVEFIQGLFYTYV